MHSQPQSIGEVFLEQVASRPSAIALLAWHGDRLERFSWQDLGHLVSRALERLDRCGVAAGAHVASWLPNGLAWIVVDLACQLRGAVHVALDARLPASAAGALARHADALLLIAPGQRMPELALPQATSATTCCEPAILASETFVEDEAPTREHARSLFAHATHAGGAQRLAGPHVPAQMLFTSGTMSAPKGVLLSHGNLLTNARAKLVFAPQYPSDVRLNVLPFAHAYARTCELSTWIVSGSQLCIARDWQEFFQLSAIVRPTLINLVPHLALKLVAALDEQAGSVGEGRAGERLLGGRLRLLQVGGAALPPAIWHRLADEGWPPLQGYGLTEASPVICSNRAGDQRCDSVGKSVPGVEMRLDDGGVLWTRGPHVMLGYWKALEETAAKIRDGWLCTGDLAEMTDDGRWRIIGRADDQISLSTGYKASPHELARRLGLDPWVEQLVIVGQDRPHLAALVYPRLSELGRELFERSADIGFSRELRGLDPERFERALVERWAAAQADLPRQLRIERVGLLREPLTSENGGLNFKGAVRRKFVEQQLLTDQIAELFRGRPASSPLNTEKVHDAQKNTKHADERPGATLRRLC